MKTEVVNSPLEISTHRPQGLKKDAIWTLSGAHMMNDLVTVGIVPALLPLYKSAFHLTYTQAGLIVLVSYLMSSVMQPLIGLITDRKPHVWFLPLGVVLSSVGLALTGLAPSFPWLLVLVSLSGLGSGVFHPEASRGAHMAAGKSKGLAQAIFQVGGNSGQAFGPLVVSLFILATGIHGLLWFLLLAVAAFVITVRILPWYRARIAEEHGKKRQIEGRNRIGAVSLLVLVVVLRSWVQIGVAGFLPFFYQHHNMSLHSAELFTFLFSGAGAVGTFIGGTLSDKIGKKWILVGSMLLSIPFAGFLPYANGVWAIVTLILFGFSVLSSFAVTVVYAQQLLPRNIALAAGLMIGFGVGAGGIGATLMGTFADHFGVTRVLEWLVVLPALAVFFSILLPGDKKLAKP